MCPWFVRVIATTTLDPALELPVKQLIVCGMYESTVFGIPYFTMAAGEGSVQRTEENFRFRTANKKIDFVGHMKGSIPCPVKTLIPTQPSGGGLHV